MPPKTIKEWFREGTPENQKQDARKRTIGLLTKDYVDLKHFCHVQCILCKSWHCFYTATDANLEVSYLEVGCLPENVGRVWFINKPITPKIAQEMTNSTLQMIKSKIK